MSHSRETASALNLWHWKYPLDQFYSECSLSAKTCLVSKHTAMIFIQSLSNLTQQNSVSSNLLQFVNPLVYISGPETSSEFHEIDKQDPVKWIRWKCFTWVIYLLRKMIQNYISVSGKSIWTSRISRWFEMRVGWWIKHSGVSGHPVLFTEPQTI